LQGINLVGSIGGSGGRTLDTDHVDGNQSPQQQQQQQQPQQPQSTLETIKLEHSTPAPPPHSSPDTATAGCSKSLLSVRSDLFAPASTSSESGGALVSRVNNLTQQQQQPPPPKIPTYVKTLKYLSNALFKGSESSVCLKRYAFTASEIRVPLSFLCLPQNQYSVSKTPVNYPGLSMLYSTLNLLHDNHRGVTPPTVKASPVDPLKFSKIVKTMKLFHSSIGLKIAELELLAVECGHEFLGSDKPQLLELQAGMQKTYTAIAATIDEFDANIRTKYPTQLAEDTIKKDRKDALDLWMSICSNGYTQWADKLYLEPTFLKHYKIQKGPNIFKS
jgi:hypothetical protein